MPATVPLATEAAAISNLAHLQSDSEVAASAQPDEDAATATGASSGRNQIKWMSTYSKAQGIQSGYGFRLLETMYESVMFSDAKKKEKNRLFPRIIKQMFRVKAPELVESHPAIFDSGNNVITVKIGSLRATAKEAYDVYMAKLPKDVTPTQREKVGQHKQADLEEPLKVILKKAGMALHGVQALNYLEVVGRYIADVEGINEKSKAAADKKKIKLEKGLAKSQESVAAREAKRRKRLHGEDDAVEEESEDDESEEDKKAVTPVASKSTTQRVSPRDFAMALANAGPSSLLKVTELSKRMDSVDASMLKTNNKMEVMDEKLSNVKLSLDLAQSTNGERLKKLEESISQSVSKGISDIMNFLQAKQGN